MKTLHWDMIGVIVGSMSTCTVLIRWFVRTIVREENATQLRQINGTYVRAMGSSVTGAEIERRLNNLEEDVIDLRQYVTERFGN